MRISTATLYARGTNSILDLQYGMFKAQSELSTGRKILSPADDPLAMSEALQVTQSKDVNKQYMTNQVTATTKLSYVDGVLDNLNNELQAIHERAIQIGNPSLAQSQRTMITAELKLRIQNVEAIANTQDGSGLYVFAGYQSASKPFDPTGSAPSASGLPYDGTTNQSYVFNGDSGRQALLISASNQLNVSVSGQELFMQVRDGQGNITGQSMFDSIKNIIELAEASTLDTANYDQTVSDLSNAISHVATIRAGVGAGLSSLESLQTASDDLDFLYQTRLSDLQDLDFTEAISRFTQLQTQMQAAQATFKQTTQLSLFNIL